MASGQVKSVLYNRGFGFIRTEDGEEVFFHRDGLAPDVSFESLRPGEAVSFDLRQGRRGPRAENVTRVAGLPAGGSA
ncbi:MAG TPA: cold shock domain-containing protein [Thermodesulfobacteriota bacterium]|nr:cold shock domain-containing protein [Thermodesulfobacteriota bacterium]